jgi:hypothetical protein
MEKGFALDGQAGARSVNTIEVLEGLNVGDQVIYQTYRRIKSRIRLNKA